MMMWFCHELDFAVRWCPCTYHDEKPRPKSSGEAYTRTSLCEVPADCIRTDGTPDLARLAVLFPAPAQAV